MSGLTFELLDDEDLEVTEHEEARATSGRPPVQCLCGRFAKYLGSQSYYNGNYDCFRYSVDCSRCGRVDVECV